MAALTIRDVELKTEYLPAQWYARTLDDRPVYIRFKYGRLSVNVGPVGGSIDEAVRSPRWYDAIVADDHDDLTFDEVCRLAGITVLAANR